MKNCGFCNLSDEDQKWLLFESDYWSVYLADKQDYVGRCIVVSRNHRESLSELDANEWTGLRTVICSLEELLRNELGAVLLNWSCLMNDAYKTSPPHPHVHFHVRPRYAAPIWIDDTCFHDEEFAHHYNNRGKDQMNHTIRVLLFTRLKQKADFYFSPIERFRI